MQRAKLTHSKRIYARSLNVHENNILILNIVRQKFLKMIEYNTTLTLEESA